VLKEDGVISAMCWDKMAILERPCTSEYAMNRKTLAWLSLITLVASLSLLAHGQTFSVIHSFQGPEGANPYTGVTLRSGVLFGTAERGGKGIGTIYEIMHLGSNWVTVPIYIFGAGDGANPRSRVSFGPDGHPYGSTFNGGSGNSGNLFNLTPPLTICKTANCFWKENVLHSFTNYPMGDGAYPSGDLVWDEQGNFYGTTQNGGPRQFGTVFQMTKSGDTWTETPLWTFSGAADGDTPAGGVIFDHDSNLLGTTRGGGLYNFGTVFKLAYTQGLGWVKTTLYSFQRGEDGGLPYAGLVFDQNGNLYGATSDGGGGGGGTIFELSPSGDTWTFSVLHSFPGQLGSLCGPAASLSIDAAGTLYGTTVCDGANHVGNIYKLTNAENGWVYTSLHEFTAGSDGANPTGGVTIDTDGTLYGTGYSGGVKGVVWMIKP
jgi:uncharacterized repeat protein (TIGR03803 family)